MKKTERPLTQTSVKIGNGIGHEHCIHAAQQFVESIAMTKDDLEEFSVILRKMEERTVCCAEFLQVINNRRLCLLNFLLQNPYRVFDKF